MNEKEKMLKGLPYNPVKSKTLFVERLRCKKLCHNYNLLNPELIGMRQGLLFKLLGRINGLFMIEQPFRCDYGYNIEIGNNFYSNYNLTILDAGKVKFGDNVFVGPNCGFYTSHHPIDAKERNTGKSYAYPITVGDNVWIGADVSVLPGVTIGSNTVIGTGSVVTKSIPANVVAAGVPCVVRKELKEEDDIYKIVKKAFLLDK